MNLILQSPSPVDGFDELVALAKPANQMRISAQCLRCEQIDISAKATIKQRAFELGIDANFVSPQCRLQDFKLLAMDMDSTLITIECIDEIADMQGLKPQVAAITEAAMRGEIEFPESLRRRVALLAGLDASALQKVFNERLRYSPGAAELTASARALGIKTLVVSGGFTFFTERVQQALQLDFAHANQLEVEHGKLTGRTIGVVVDAEEKQRTVLRICDELGIAPEQAIVIGDGANDLKMMHVAGLSVAYRAKPVVRAQTHATLDFCGLDGVLNFFPSLEGGACNN